MTQEKSDTRPLHSLLLVDDEDGVRAALRRALRGERYEILEAASGRAGLEILRARPVDVIIADNLMPAMNGLEFLCAARMVRPDSVRLILTGHADLETAVRAINEGSVFRFLAKPWDTQALKVLLCLAVRHLESERRSARLLKAFGPEADRLEKLQDENPGVMSVERDENGAILIPADTLES